jgi:general secretion pathway protein D
MTASYRLRFRPAYIAAICIAPICIPALLAGCTHEQINTEMTPTFPPKSADRLATPPLSFGSKETRTRIEAGPAAPVPAQSTGPKDYSPPPTLGTAKVETLSLEQVPLPAFIDEVYAKALKLTVQIDQAASTRTDLVTLRTGSPLPPDQLYTMASKILAGYGLAASWDGGVVHITSDTAMAAQMPDLIRSRALPDLPRALRPIFQVVDLHQVSAADLIQTLSNAFGTKVKVFSDLRNNTVMIFGLPENVRAAMEAIQALDQARLAGRQSLRISPVYWTAPKLASKLSDLLRAEGYDASVMSGNVTGGAATAIVIVPLEASNSVVVFAADASVLAHVQRWATDLDQPAKADPSRSIFVYAVQNTTASSLGRTIQSVLGGTTTAGSSQTEARLDQAGQTASTPSSAGGGGLSNSTPTPRPQPAAGGDDQDTPVASSSNNGGPRIVIDSTRNSLVFVGNAQDYERVRPVLEALDKPPREALIEVTVAEVNLDNSSSLGVEWSLFNHLGSGLNQAAGTGTNSIPTTTATGSASSSSSGTSAGIAIGSTGFNYAILNNLGDVRLLLNAVATESNINVISTPRILAKSGTQASIDVGNEVPIITSQATSSQVSTSGTSGILQSIEYQKTGVILSVTPVVHSGDRIDLTISQEVSQAVTTTTSGISSPTIQNRNISTSLTLADGATVVIGGLISDTRSDSNNGIPYLEDIPGLGWLFKNQSVTRTRQELLVFITPFVISTDDDAATITSAFQSQMQRWPSPNSELHW